MKDFEKNKCRVCYKCFCCAKCRANHEIKKHKINPKCDICLYGKVYLSDIDESVQRHIKSDHWPLHCVLCNRVFGTFNEISGHSKCPMAKSHSENVIVQSSTPPLSSSSKKFDTPPFQVLKGIENNQLLSNLATSTPMQKLEENKPFLGLQEAITPVDYLNENKKPSNKKEDRVNQSAKVTFLKTPSTEVPMKQKNLAIANYANIQDTQSPEAIVQASSAFTTAEIFYSLKEATHEEAIKQTPKIVKEVNEQYMKYEKSSFEESNMFQSAINMSIIEETENRNPSSRGFTPIQVKKSRISIVGVVMQDERYVVPASSTKIHHSSEVSGDYGNQKPSNLTLNNSTTKRPRLWESMSNIVKNVMHNFSTIRDDKSELKLKRSYSDMTDSYEEKPYVKRYKLTDIKCRRPIRQSSEIATYKKYNNELAPYSNSFSNKNEFKGQHIFTEHKIFVDKATQTDF